MDGKIEVHYLVIANIAIFVKLNGHEIPFLQKREIFLREKIKGNTVINLKRR